MIRTHILSKIVLFSFFFFLFLVVFLSTQLKVDAAEYCDASGVTVTSTETRTYNFYFSTVCEQYFPGQCSGGIATWQIVTPTYFPNCNAYLSEGKIPHPSIAGTICEPQSVSCWNNSAYDYEYNVPIGGGMCQDQWKCGEIVVQGRTLQPANSCQMDNTCFNSYSVVNNFCQVILPGGPLNGVPYTCTTPPSGDPPSNLDLRITVWSDSSRSTAFSGQNNLKTAWGYSLAPYRVSWGSVTDADSCTLNGTPVSVSGGSWNTLTVGNNQTTASFTLSCTNSNGTTNDTATLYVPPRPVSPMSGSCPAPGTTGTFSWTSPTQNVGGISSWNTFMTRARVNAGADLGAPAWDDNFVGTSKSFSSSADTTYDWWVHTKHNLGGGNYVYSDHVGGTFTCSLPSLDDSSCTSITMSNPNPTVGETFTGTVTMLNNGSTTWVSPTQGGNYRLVSQNPQGNNTWGMTQVDMPISTLTSARYVRINVPSSNSWVGVVEIEVYDTDNNRILPVSCGASATNGAYVCGNVSDSNMGTIWNSGNFGAFVTVDLGSIRNISRIRAYMTASPSPTNGTVQIQSSDTGASYTTLRQYTNYATATWYQASYGDPNRSSTFTFTATAPATAGTYNFDFGMSTGGSAFGQICSISNVNVNAPVTPITVTLSASPQTMTLPTNSTDLTWTTTGSPTSCTASGSWSGTKSATGGTEPRTGLTAGTHTYIITCSKSGVSDDVDQSIVIVNNPVNFTLNVIKSGQGTVTSTSNPPQTNINCGSICSTSYESGTTVVLSATPATGRIFTGWSEACSGTPRTSSCNVTINGSTTVIVNFAVDPNYREF